MKITTIILALFFSTAALAAPAQVLIIRHAEKPEDGNGLSEKGFKRALALVQYFKSNPDVTQHGTPAAIFAMKPKDENGSIRAIQTVSPLAQNLGLPVNTPFMKLELSELVNKINSNQQYNGKTVLICWEHKVIPDMAKIFGVNPRPSDWPGEDFETVFEIDFTGNKVSKFKTFKENLKGLDF